MKDFTNKRRRYSDVPGEDYIAGEIIDPTDAHSRVHYETARRFADNESRINWSAHGSVSVEEARTYATQILAACDAAEVGPRAFEPHDEVTLDGELKDSERAFVYDIDGNGAVTLKISHPARENVRTHTVLPSQVESLSRVVV